METHVDYWVSLYESLKLLDDRMKTSEGMSLPTRLDFRDTLGEPFLENTVVDWEPATNTLGYQFSGWDLGTRRHMLEEERSASGWEGL